MRAQGRLWTGIWIYLMRPVMRLLLERLTSRKGWRYRYDKAMLRLRSANLFPDL